jgi:hypothetical protein
MNDVRQFFQRGYEREVHSRFEVLGFFENLFREDTEGNPGLLSGLRTNFISFSPHTK